MQRIPVAIALLLTLAACGQTSSPVTDQQSSAAVSIAQSSEPVPLATSNAASTAPVTTSKANAPAARTVEVTVESWSFSPSTISAKHGEKLTLRLIGKSGKHSFSVPDLGINAHIEAGQTVDVVMPTDRVGSFLAKCSVPCGSGHRDMHATILIEE